MGSSHDCCAWQGLERFPEGVGCFLPVHLHTCTCTSVAWIHVHNSAHKYSADPLRCQDSQCMCVWVGSPMHTHVLHVLCMCVYAYMHVRTYMCVHAQTRGPLRV